MNSNKSAILLLSEKNKPNPFLILNSCFIGSVYTHQYGVFYVTTSIGYNMHYLGHYFWKEREKNSIRKRVYIKWHWLTRYKMKCKFIIVYYWLADGEEGCGRTARVLRHQTPHLIKFCCKARHSISPYYTYPYTACSLRFTLQNFPPWILAN